MILILKWRDLFVFRWWVMNGGGITLLRFVCLYLLCGDRVLGAFVTLIAQHVVRCTIIRAIITCVLLSLLIYLCARGYVILIYAMFTYPLCVVHSLYSVGIILLRYLHFVTERYCLTTCCCCYSCGVTWRCIDGEHTACTTCLIRCYAVLLLCRVLSALRCIVPGDAYLLVVYVDSCATHYYRDLFIMILSLLLRCSPRYLLLFTHLLITTRLTLLIIALFWWLPQVGTCSRLWRLCSWAMEFPLFAVTLLDTITFVRSGYVALGALLTHSLALKYDLMMPMVEKFVTHCVVPLLVMFNLLRWFWVAALFVVVMMIMLILLLLLSDLVTCYITLPMIVDTWSLCGDAWRCDTENSPVTVPMLLMPLLMLRLRYSTCSCYCLLLILRCLHCYIVIRYCIVIDTDCLLLWCSFYCCWFTRCGIDAVVVVIVDVVPIVRTIVVLVIPFVLLTLILLRFTFDMMTDNSTCCWWWFVPGPEMKMQWWYLVLHWYVRYWCSAGIHYSHERKWYEIIKTDDDILKWCQWYYKCRYSDDEEIVVMC